MQAKDDRLARAARARKAEADRQQAALEAFRLRTRSTAQVEADAELARAKSTGGDQ